MKATKAVKARILRELPWMSAHELDELRSTDEIRFGRISAELLRTTLRSSTFSGAMWSGGQEERGYAVKSDGTTFAFQVSGESRTGSGRDEEFWSTPTIGEQIADCDDDIQYVVVHWNDDPYQGEASQGVNIYKRGKYDVAAFVSEQSKAQVAEAAREMNDANVKFACVRVEETSPGDGTVVFSVSYETEELHRVVSRCSSGGFDQAIWDGDFGCVVRLALRKAKLRNTNVILEGRIVSAVIPRF